MGFSNSCSKNQSPETKKVVSGESKEVKETHNEMKMCVVADGVQDQL